LIQNKHLDDAAEIQLSRKAQEKFDKRAFLEFKNYIEKEFDQQEEMYKLNKNSDFEFFRHKSKFDEDNKLALYTPDGLIVKGFNQIEGIHDPMITNLGFLVANWTGYFIGMDGYDPDHGHFFKKSIKERQVRENIEKLQNEWHLKRNEYSYSNSEQVN
jgi:hypothetical protein